MCFIEFSRFKLSLFRERKECANKQRPLLKELTMISKKNLSILLCAVMSLSSTVVKAPFGCCSRRVVEQVITSATAAALTPGGDPVGAATTAVLAATKASIVTTILNPSMDIETVSDILASNIRSLFAISARDSATLGLDTLAFNLQSQMEGAATYFGLDARTLQSMAEADATARGEEKEEDVARVLQNVARLLTASMSDSLPLLRSSLASAMQSRTNSPIVKTFLSYLRDLVKGDTHDEDTKSTISYRSRFTIAAMETNISSLGDAVEAGLSAGAASGAASATGSSKTDRK